MKARVISRDNGFGLSRDMQLVCDVLREAGVEAQPLGMGGDRLANGLRLAGMRLAQRWRGSPDVQLFLERIYPGWLPLARRNLLIPNPEWTHEDSRPLLSRFTRVLCKTRHAVAIFDALGCATRYIGFTSIDRLDPAVARERRFFHLAGRSAAKGTQAVLAAWRRHPEWPSLTVVQSAKTAQPGAAAANIEHVVDHVDDARLRELQNRHLFHLCPSEAEGFGHYIVEALGVGAIVLATDGAPMNELVTPERGLLIPPARTARLNFSPQYFVEAEAVEAAVERALAMDAAQCASLSAAARDFFVANDRAFRERLVTAVREAID